MATAIEELRESLLAQVEAAASSAALEEVRVSALGRKGAITEQMKSLGKMAPDERKAAGQAFNALKDEVAAALEARKAGLASAELETSFSFVSPADRAAMRDEAASALAAPPAASDCRRWFSRRSFLLLLSKRSRLRGSSFIPSKENW